MGDGFEGPRRRLFRLGHRAPDPGDAVRWEYEHYLEERAERLEAEGWDPQEARREAERRFGEGHRRRMERIERRRTMTTWMGGLWSVARDAVINVGRTLRRSPGFVLGVVATLALGIGANALVFGMVDRLLLTPPRHLEAPDELRFVIVQREVGSQASMTFPDFADLRAHRGLQGVGAMGYVRPITRGSGPDAEDLDARAVTHDFFTTLGVRPALGRFFTREEDLPGVPGTMVLSAEYWERAFGSDPAVLGRTLRLSGDPYTVVGVLPEGFTGVTLDRVDVWLPLETHQALSTGGELWKTSRGWWWLNAVVRLSPERTAAAAGEEATRLHQSARSEGQEELYSRTSLRLDPLLAARGSGGENRVVRWLAGVSLVVLLIACANVANLLLARGVRRRRETAVRLALGISRRRLVGERMVETVLLAGLGGVVALALASQGGILVRRILLPDVYFPEGGVSLRVLAFAAVISLLAGLLAGVGPALQGRRSDIAAPLGDAARGSSGRRSRLRGGLAVAQAALSVVLLVGAGLFVRSLHQVRGLDLGLDADRVVLSTLELDGELDARETTALYREAARLLEREPTVVAATVTSVPFRSAYADRLAVPGMDSIPRLPGGGPYRWEVDPGYFATLGLQLLRGRGFETADGADAAPVAVVSETMARTLWPNDDALGQCLLLGTDPDACTTVVGVVEDAARSGIQEEAFMAYYLPLEQQDRAATALYLRAAGDPDEARALAQRLLPGFDPRVRFARSQTLREILDPQARSWSLGASMFTLFGLLALVVASVGLYSLLAFEVAERTRELGIRTALGADRGALLGRVVWTGTRLTLVGALAGLAAAWTAGPYAGDLLFRTSPRDPLVFGGVAVVLLAVAVTASLVPALRATRVDPLVALRSE